MKTASSHRYGLRPVVTEPASRYGVGGYRDDAQGLPGTTPESSQVCEQTVQHVGPHLPSMGYRGESSRSFFPRATSLARGASAVLNMSLTPERQGDVPDGTSGRSAPPRREPFHWWWSSTGVLREDGSTGGGAASSYALPPAVEGEIQRILNRAARRKLMQRAALVDSGSHHEPATTTVTRPVPLPGATSTRSITAAMSPR